MVPTLPEIAMLEVIPAAVIGTGVKTRTVRLNMRPEDIIAEADLHEWLRDIQLVLSGREQYHLTK